jgi:hypothetical protein
MRRRHRQAIGVIGLKLDAIPPGIGGDIDQLQGKIQIAVMVGGKLCDEETFLPLAKGKILNLNRLDHAGVFLSARARVKAL